MATPNDRNQPPTQSGSFQPDQLPPDVKIIECSCANAENRSPDNSTWTNIIKEPIKIQAGSEIRVQSKFIDMRGMSSRLKNVILHDQDIIDKRWAEFTNTIVYSQ